MTADVYETVDGFSAVAGHHVFKSADLGATWADVSASLPNVPFETVVVSGGAVYAGSDNGVFASLDGGSSWNRLGTNLPNARVFFLVVQSSTVFAFTHGRGAWQIAAPSQPGSRTPVLPAPPTAAPARDLALRSRHTGPVAPALRPTISAHRGHDWDGCPRSARSIARFAILSTTMSK